MGTNYYLSSRPACECCGRPFEQLHIGKSSGGWCFSLHVIPEEGINDLDDWKRLWSESGREITDEYGKTIAPSEMLNVITERSWGKKSDNGKKWFEENHAQPGPKGLARHAVGRFCKSHGAGTWDCIEGEFS